VFVALFATFIATSAEVRRLIAILVCLAA